MPPHHAANGALGWREGRSLLLWQNLKVNFDLREYPESFLFPYVSVKKLLSPRRYLGKLYERISAKNSYRRLERSFEKSRV